MLLISYNYYEIDIFSAMVVLLVFPMVLKKDLIS